MREKQQAVLSWIVVALVVVMLFFPLRALLRYGSTPAPVAVQPTVSAMLTQVAAAAPEIISTAPAASVPAASAPAASPEAASDPIPSMDKATSETSQKAAADEVIPSEKDADPTAASAAGIFPSDPSATMPDTAPEAPLPAMPFRVQAGSPRYMPAFSHPEQGCAWTGLAGQVFDADGGSRNEMVVFVSGVLEGQPVNYVAVTGSHSDYGPGGYEIALSDHLPAAQTALTVQLFDVEGRPLSDPVLMNLPADCSQNLMLVNFQANFETIDLFIPLVAAH